jgi:hypothetical protein
VNTLHSGRTDEEARAWCLENVMLARRRRLGLRQVSPANLPTCRVVVGFIKPELKHWGEHLIAVSIFSSLQYRTTKERNVSHLKRRSRWRVRSSASLKKRIWKDCGGVD